HLIQKIKGLIEFCSGDGIYWHRIDCIMQVHRHGKKTLQKCVVKFAGYPRTLRKSCLVIIKSMLRPVEPECLLGKGTVVIVDFGPSAGWIEVKQRSCKTTGTHCNCSPSEIDQLLVDPLIIINCSMPQPAPERVYHNPAIREHRPGSFSA